MKPAALRERRDRVPFRAFVIELMSGTRLTVRHPENIMITKHLGVVRTAGDDAVLFTPQEVAAVFPIRNGR